MVGWVSGGLAGWRVGGLVVGGGWDGWVGRSVGRLVGSAGRLRSVGRSVEQLVSVGFVCLVSGFGPSASKRFY